MNTQDSHQARVYAELTAAGMTSYGHLKSSSRYLHHFIHNDERICGVTYGRYAGGTALLVATDRRIVFLDKKPLFTSSDELSYESVSGVKYSVAGFFGSITLHTKLGNYQLRYVNKNATGQFVRYIESRIETRPGSTDVSSAKLPLTPSMSLEGAAAKFLYDHDTAVLSTMDRAGNVYGAVVNYVVGPHDTLYVLTQSGTTKVRNTLGHQQVAVTIYDQDTVKTLQIDGLAEIEEREPTKSEMMSAIIKLNAGDDRNVVPPILLIDNGVFVMLRISVVAAKYHNYRS